MPRTRTRNLHRVVLVAAAAVVLIGVALLFSPLDGLFVVLAWVFIVVAVVAAALALFLV